MNNRIGQAMLLGLLALVAAPANAQSVLRGLLDAVPTTPPPPPPARVTASVAAAPKIKCSDSAASGDVKVVTTWDGVCIDGLADGFGRMSTTTTSTISDSWSVRQGTIVNGQQVGMWCSDPFRMRTPENGDVTVPDTDLCTLVYAPPFQAWAGLSFRHDPDGGWRIAKVGQSVLKAPILIARETMDNIILAKTPPGAVQLPDFPFTTPMLDSLTPGSAASGAGDMLHMADISGKRIAIILSNGTVAELARFAKQRDAFIKSHGYGQKFTGSPFITVGTDVSDGTIAGVTAITDPARFVPSVIGALRSIAGPDAQIVPADDLGVLTSGAADFALVIDWRFDGGILSPAQIAKIPLCTPKAECTPIFKQYYAAMLIDPKIHTVGLLTDAIGGSQRFSASPYDSEINAAFRYLWSGNGEYGTKAMFATLLRGMPWSKLEPLVRRAWTGPDAKETGRAITLLNYGTERKDPGALRILGQFYETGYLPPDVPEMLKAFREAAALGDVPAMTELASLYMGKNGVARDNREAGKYVEMAYAKEKTALTTFHAGVSKANGWTGPADLVEALRLYEAAAALGATGTEPYIADTRAKLAAQASAEAGRKAAADAEAAFAASLQTTPTAAALFLQADDLAGKGETAHARLAFRAIIARFPTSPFAANAATRLSALPPAP